MLNTSLKGRIVIDIQDIVTHLTASAINQETKESGKKISYACKLCSNPKNGYEPYETPLTKNLRIHMFLLHQVDEKSTNWDKYFKACRKETIEIKPQLETTERNEIACSNSSKTGEKRKTDSDQEDSSMSKVLKTDQNSEKI